MPPQKKEFLAWVAARRFPITIEAIHHRFDCSRATAYRWQACWRAQQQADLLDRVIDNPSTGQREIWRGGVIKATAPRNCCDAPMLKAYGATGAWGTFAAERGITA